MSAKEVWFHYKWVLMGGTFWPCHWKGWVLFFATTWTCAPIAYAGIFLLPQEYFFFVWLVLAVIMGTAFAIGFRHSERRHPGHRNPPRFMQKQIEVAQPHRRSLRLNVLSYLGLSFAVDDAAGQWRQDLNVYVLVSR